MATATGKTVAGIAAIAECCGVLPEDPDHEPRTDDAKIMIVAHSNAILKQWEQEIQEKLGLPMPAGQTGEQAESVSFSGGEVEFYTAQSLLPRYDRDLADQYDLVIYDEVHHYSNLDGYGAAIDRPNYRAAMGLSATIGDDGELKREQLTELLGDVVHTYGVEDARRDGIIPEFDWTVHPTPLDPYEREEWDEATESISDQFKHIRRSAATKRILRQVPVPFTELEDLGDFIRAHEAASMVFDDEEIPDEWSNLQATIHSRTWIRHRSQPKIEEAIELAKDYLEDPDQPVKLVIFAMDIDTADEIADQLGEVSDHVYRAHSQLETSSKKNNETVQRNINKFGKCENGVLVSPKMLDEGLTSRMLKSASTSRGLKRSCNSFSGWDASSANTAISGPTSTISSPCPTRTTSRGWTRRSTYRSSTGCGNWGDDRSAADHRGGRRRRRTAGARRTAWARTVGPRSA